MPKPQPPLLRLFGISKYFGGVRALHGISLDFHSGEIVALIGDNGAGKSTLVNVLCGILEPDEGEIQLGQTRVDRMTARDARRFGIETVHQHLSLCDNLSASANVMLGQEPLRWQFGPVRVIDERRCDEETKRLLHQVGGSVPDLHAPVRRLSGGQRQAVAIARALVNAHRLIILDEPTAALGVRQTMATLNLIRAVASQGVAVILISHNLDDVFAVAHRIVAMRLGKISLDASASSTTRHAAVAAMTGITDLQPISS